LLGASFQSILEIRMRDDFVVDLPEELDPLQDVDSLLLGDGLDVHLVNVLKKGKNIFSYKNDLQH
jgi:hypothetical protein